jgi:hypothetical protein
MGGYGSTRWGWRATRRTTAEYRAVRIADVRKSLALKPGGEKLTIAGHTVELDWTFCQYGGARPWFQCPECDRRAGVLYLAQRGPRCRRCLGLAYRSQHENRRDRLASKGERIRARLGGEPCIFDWFPDKPPGMHWRTYSGIRKYVLTARRRACILGRISTVIRH